MLRWFGSRTVYKLRGRYGDWKFEVLLIDVVIGVALIISLTALAIWSGPVALLAATVAGWAWACVTLRRR